jgi:indole-3-glycerol phosphate synthase
MSDKLAEICAAKRELVAQRKTIVTQAELAARSREQEAPRGFQAALTAKSGFGLIAEIKRASPSKGLIREHFDPPAHAIDYAANGAACLSVLTDEAYFLGHDDFLVAARNACALPVLRKDFMVDPWQVLETRALGADAILIIVAALEDNEMAEIEAAALQSGMDVLVEVHDAPELERALALRTRMIGINNRNLKTFETNLETTEQLAVRVPAEYLVVSESGITSHADCTRLAKCGVRSFLVGEALMRQSDIATATRMLLTGHG